MFRVAYISSKEIRIICPNGEIIISKNWTYPKIFKYKSKHYVYICNNKNTDIGVYELTKQPTAIE